MFELGGLRSDVVDGMIRSGNLWKPDITPACESSLSACSLVFPLCLARSNAGCDLLFDFLANMYALASVVCPFLGTPRVM